MEEKKVIVLQEVLDRISKSFNIEPEKLSRDTSFVTDLGFDSINMLELMSMIEEIADCEIPDEDLEKLTSVGSTIAYFESKGYKIE